MLELDPAVTAALDRLVPPTVEKRDWDRVLAPTKDLPPEPLAGASSPSLGRTPPRRLVLALAIAALACLIPLVALGADGRLSFWSSHRSGPGPFGTPSGRAVVVATGDWNGVPWQLTALISGQGTIVRPDGTIASQPGVCVALSANEPAGTQSPDSCSPIRGVAGKPGSDAEGWITYSRTPAGTGQVVDEGVAGAVADGVAGVEIELADGTTLDPPLVRGSGVGGLRFYVAQTSPQAVAAVVACDDAGDVLQRLVVA